MKRLLLSSTEALNYLLKNINEHVLVLGRAGTGKTTLVKKFMEKTTENAAVVAPTGIAALNAGGRTIHSFFSFRRGITIEDVEEMAYEKRPPKIIKELETLVIDEISMVRADLMDCIDRYLKLARKREREPFGGVRLILVGDLLQLPPVVTEDEKDFFREVYETEYFYSSNSFKRIEPDLTAIELTEIYRQEDPEFIALLERIRTGKAKKEDLELLNSKIVSWDEIPENTIILSPYKRKVDEINKRKLDELGGKLYEFEAFIEGDVRENMYPADEVLQIKEGAQVVMLNNDKLKRWVNGTIATVEKIYDKSPPVILVRLENGSEAMVERVRWEIYKYRWNQKEKKIESFVVGVFEQFPLKPAWAITIHKSQGMTLKNVAIDLDDGTFAPNQLYVALSRARSLKGIYLLSRVYLSDIKIDWRTIGYINSLSEE